jgi:large subunit ribosomal protein L33
MAKGPARVIITLECTECRNSGLPGVHRFNYTKNKRNQQARIEIKRYCPFERKHTIHKETR